MLENDGNLQSLTRGLRLKVRIQHPEVHERTDRGGSYWYFRYWDDVLQADGTMKADGQIIYAATDLRVGLFETGEQPVAA